jgi:hypothetical protein
VSKTQKKDLVERLSGIVDTEDARFEKLKRDN